MAKIWQISDGRSYVVNGDPGTTITYTNSTSNGTAAGKQAASIPAGATSVTFPSNGAEVEISSDTATIDQVFNAAAAGSGSSSGGSGSAGGVTFQVVDTLPSQGAAGVIYLVKVSETGDDKFEEWIWVDSAWESIGTTAVDPTTYAKLIGGNTFEGNQVINGDLTVTGDVSGVTESTYNVVETAETTITPTGGTWVRYTGSETALTIEEPGWDGEAEISYLETAAPVDLQGVTWNPAKPILTGNGPFVYTLVHAGDGQMLAGAYGYSVATAEAIQAVAPIAWTTFDTDPVVTGDNSLAIGNGSQADNGVAIGVGAKARVTGGVVVGSGSTTGDYGTVLGSGTAHVAAVAIGTGANASHNRAISIGYASSSNAFSVVVGSEVTTSRPTTVTIGSIFTETVDSQNVTRTCTTEGSGSITIGAGANTLNNGDVESSNSVTIGCKASNSGADSVVIGAQASNAFGLANVALGVEAKTYSYGNCIAVGSKSEAKSTGNIVLGYNAKGSGSYAMALGMDSNVSGKLAVAIGYKANNADQGCVVFASWSDIASTKTQLYFAGANTPLANTYEDGEAMMGYVVRDSAGNVMTDAEGNAMVGTQKLSVLFPNNRGENAFSPAVLDLDGEYTPKPMFRPSDLDLPVEEPTEEPEDVTITIPEPVIPEPEPYTPLPVYPITEPENVETDILDSESYTPLPVYPIVEPEIPTE